jgi:hyperosmotically inducible periplasmic protein
MRLRAYSCAAALTLLGVGGCDRAPSAAEGSSTATTAASNADWGQSDPLITARIEAKYFASPEVKAHRIDVDTRNGLVTLEGTVDSEAQRDAAGSIARSVEGVTRVENKLLVRAAGDAAADTPRHHAEDRSLPRRDGRSPAWITAKVQSQYYLNPSLKPWRIDVDTASSGAVTLSGSVDSEADRGEAVRIARATEGVTAVNDNLRVQPQSVATTGATKDTAVDDTWITMKIQSKFFLDDDVRGRNIDVDTRNGMVTLKGAVKSEGERQHALAVARSTDGVTMVHDSLVVDREIKSSWADNAIDDAWITMKIQSKYFIHDEIKSRKVNVDTRKGVVTLNGSVPSATAKGAAEVIAQDTDGVSRVINQLKIEPAN